MALISQKQDDHTITIGPGYSTSPYNETFDPRKADRAAIPYGLSDDKVVYTMFYDSVFFGFWTFSAAPSDSYNQLYFGGRTYSYGNPDFEQVAYAYSPDISGERTGSIPALAMTLNPAQPYGYDLLSGRYFTVGNSSGVSIVHGAAGDLGAFRALKLPAGGSASVDIVDAFRLPEGYRIPRQFIEINTQIGTRHISGERYQTLIRLQEGLSGPLKWFLIDYTLGGDSSYQEFQLSDPEDDATINLTLVPAMYGTDETKIFADENGWLLTVDGTNDDLVRVLRYFQLSADLSAYRELTPVGSTETVQLYLDNFPFYPMTDVGGNLLMLFPLGGMVLSSSDPIYPFGPEPVSANPNLKGWGMTLDGHDFFVLKLGMSGKTLVYDISTGEWSWWSQGEGDAWRPAIGLNWDSAGGLPQNYGTNIIVGDDTTGGLWVLDPDYGLDDDAATGEPAPFERIATGQVPLRGREFLRFNSIFLTASLGEPALTENLATLSYSDDDGETFRSAQAPITVIDGDYRQEFTWRSIGMGRAPGRLLRLTDNGSFARIDSLDVNPGEDE